MLDRFNLLASTYRRRENDLISELWYFLRELGDKGVRASPTGLPGLVVLLSELDPVFVVEKVAEKAAQEPWFFRFLLRIEPIELCVPTDLAEIRRAALELASKKLSASDTYRVEVRRRLTDLSREDVISAIASGLPNKVKLENPDKIVLVEVIGKVTGISVIEPRHIVSIQRVRRQASLGASSEPGDI
ncbi:MAG: THUMP domain-containing protein [Thermofilum sp.]|jgi:tRNA acetyltransferase TAN1|nr:THUMP domain-containing protein [Thermofilum sp.]MCC6064394.1 THUMP domain-containing protein [Thermofilum sp.]